MARLLLPFGAVATLTQHPRVQEMLGSILMGIALGLVVLLVLSAYPGEPFDYSKPDGGRAERQAAAMMAGNGRSKKEEEEEEDGGKVEVRVAVDGWGSTTTTTSSSSTSSSSSTTTTTTTSTSMRHRRNKDTRGRNGSSSSSSSSGSSGSSGSSSADYDGQQQAKTDALHRLLVQEDRVWQRLQLLPPSMRGMLGLSEDGVRLAVRLAVRRVDGGKKEEEDEQEQEGNMTAAAGAFVDQGRLSSRVDLVFYLLAFSALIYVIHMEYGHCATRVFARFFPKEAAVLGFE